MAKKTVTKKPSRLTEIYLAEKKAGGSLGSAIGKATLEKIDPRQFFNQKGLLANILPSFFKTYKAPTGTASKPKTTSSIASVLTTSSLENKVDALSEETRLVGVNSRITAKNTLVLPMIARDMNLMRQNIFRLVKRQTGAATNKSDMFFAQAAGREVAYESKFRREGGVKSLMSPTPSTSGSSNVVGGVLSTLGGLFKGALSGAGSLFGGLASVVGGVIGGIGGFLGGAAKGIFNVISGALGGAGILGILAAAGIGYILHQMYQNLDLTDIKKKLGLENFSFESLSEEMRKMAENLRKNVDEVTGGRFSETLKFIEKTFADIALKTIAVVQTGMQIMTNIFTAAVKDMQGYGLNFFNENKGNILAGIAAYGAASTLGIGVLNPKGLLAAGGLAALAKLYGDATGEKTVAELEESVPKRFAEIEKKQKELNEKNAIPDDKKTRYDYTRIAQLNRELKTEREIFTSESNLLAMKKGVGGGRTGNLELALKETANPSKIYEQNVAKLQSNMPSLSGTSPTPVSGDKTFNSLSKVEQDTLLRNQAVAEGINKKDSIAFTHNNPGNIIAKSPTEVYAEQAKFGGIPGKTVTGPDGKVRTFVKFPTMEAGIEAQRDLWSRKFGNTPINDALKSWVDPKNQQEMASYSKTTLSGLNVSMSPEKEPKKMSQAPVTPSSPSIMERFKSVLNIDSGKVSSATIDVSQARIQIGSAPIVVAPPTVNVQAPQIQGGTGGFGAMASSSVVDTEFMKLLVGRTVTL